MYKLQVKSRSRSELIEITGLVRDVLTKHPIKDGLCMVFVPHTTAGITINENADPDVKSDILLGLERMASQKEFRHVEGNSDAHLKASLMGSSQLVLVENGALVLGTWQGIYLAEFDGPRSRTIIIKLLANLREDN